MAATREVNPDPEDEGTTDFAVANRFTLVRHHAYIYGGDKHFEQALQVQVVSTAREVTRVKKADGVLFDTYAEAQALVNAAHNAADGGDLLGAFSTKVIGEAPIYVPVRKAVA